jgi:hypothetical protein
MQKLLHRFNVKEQKAIENKDHYGVQTSNGCTTLRTLIQLKKLLERI